MNTRIIGAGLAAALLVAAAAGCSRQSTGSGAAPAVNVGNGAANGVLVGADQPRSDTDFWSAYAGFMGPKAAAAGVALANTSSDNDSNRLKSNVDTLLSKNVKSLIIAPQDTAAVKPALADAAAKNVPVVSVDTRPDSGGAYMVVRADNRAYGTKSCTYLGETLHGTGKVVEFQGDLTSINGRDRSEAFADCMKSKYPGIKVIEIPTEWKPDKAVSGLQDKLLTDPDINGIYMQASIYLQPTVALLQRENKLVKAGQPGHITIVSNDGVKAELDAIDSGQMDATISQPADQYAQYAVYYAKAATEGKKFAPGPTDHNSTIVDTGVNGQLEDQLPAPVVTHNGGKVGDMDTLATSDPGLWGRGGH
ncbi:sugar ABC transporter substrate-binding protein [Nocardia jiangxiensis]|uniref:Sugar ABC transporter substrate-binding protein n=1 Tax=Nocardia jiangxiensis TaxID=282685 RepID=A0ABW6SIG9_9NOCA|nr:sugar ABC transporter substrate-binding protein [Nocardia jiangxiensis]